MSPKTHLVDINNISDVITPIATIGAADALYDDIIDKFDSGYKVAIGYLPNDVRHVFANKEEFQEYWDRATGKATENEVELEDPEEGSENAKLNEEIMKILKLVDKNK